MKKPPAAPKPDLHAVVEALAEASTALTEMPLGRREFPSRMAVAAIVEDLRALLFPGYFGASELTLDTLRYHLGARMDRVSHSLGDQIQRGLMASDPTCTSCGERAKGMALAFLAQLPEVRRLLATDIQAGFEGDPAATSPEEVLFSYPGLLAVASQRLAHELLKLGVPLVIARRSSKVYEGSAVNINYVSGSSGHIETMSLSRRAVQEGQKCLIVDDFLKGGGTAKGMVDLMREFNVDVVGMTFVMSTAKPVKKRVMGEKSLMVMDIDQEHETVLVKPAFWLNGDA